MKKTTNRKSSKREDYLEGGDVEVSNGVPGDAIQCKPLEVKVYNNNFDRAFKAFRSLVQKDRTLSEFKDRQRFEKKSDKLRRKQKEARKKASEL